MLGLDDFSIYIYIYISIFYIYIYIPAMFGSLFAMFGSLFVIYPSGRWPSGNITNKFLTAGVYLTYTPLGHGLYITYIYVYGRCFTQSDWSI